MNLKDFTEQQRQALLELAMLAMYADGHLASAEDERVRRLLTEMGFPTAYDCNKQYDAAVSRVSRHCPTVAAARARTATLAQCFTTHEQRRAVHDLLEDVLASDSRVAPQESGYLAVVREALQM